VRLARLLFLLPPLPLVLLVPRSGAAQITPMAIGNVRVTPDGGGPIYVAPSTGDQVTFDVLNNFDTPQEYELTCTKAGKVTSCSPEIGSIYLQPYQTLDVTVSFSVGAALGTGTVTLRADGNVAWNTGYYNVTVGSPGPPTVALANHSADNWDRGDCLVLGAGEAALQCGDLLVAHGLPATRTLGKERAPTLVYSSRQAAPRFVVAANVSQPSGKPLPDLVKVRLLRGGVALDSTTYYGSEWTVGGTRQVVIAASDVVATGAYALTLEVRNNHGTTVNTTSQALVLPFVDRRTTAFGRGWWLAGYEQLVLNQPGGTGTGLLWLGADGSAALYAKVNDSTWTAPLGSFRDQIVWQADSFRYVRRLRHRVEVHYDALGRHVETRDRVGHRTVFTHDGNGRLSQITVPPSGVTGTTFALAYNGSGRLTQLTDPVGRALVLTDSSGSVSRVRDPDLRYTWFGYDTGGRLTARKGRGGYTVRYEYAKGLRVTKVRVPYGPTGADTAVTVLTPWDERGLGAGALVDPTQVYTHLLGPRVGVADDAKFWVDRWGAPTKIVDAVGATTLISRGDPGRPALVTLVVSADGRVDSLTYDARGNLAVERLITSGVAGGALPTRVTTYDYDDPDAPDSPSKVTDAMGRFTTYAYGALGLPETVTDPAGHQTTFTYFGTPAANGLIQAVTEQDVETWLEGGTDTADQPRDLTTAFTYDPLGNVRTTVGPTGARTYIHADSAGRPTYTVDHYGRAQRWGYTVLNEANRHVRYTAKLAHPDGVNPATLCQATLVTCTDLYQPVDASLGDSLVTVYYHGPVGLDSVMDPRGNTRGYRYDARDQLWQDLDEYDQAREFTYDASGALIRSLSRLSYYPTDPRDTVWVHRDVLGRDTATVYTESGFPPNEIIPGDTLRTAYDIMGRVTQRWNRDPSYPYAVKWSYYGDGSVRTQTTALGLTASGDTLRYTYDTTGAIRGTARMHGGNRDSTTYVYNGTTGRLLSLTAHWGVPVNQSRTIQFTFDGLGRRREVLYPNQFTVKFRYGADGSMRRAVSVHANPPFPNDDNFTFTRRLLEVDAVGQAHGEHLDCIGTSSASDNVASLCGSGNHSGVLERDLDRLGQLIYQPSPGGSAEWYRYDAAGNLVWRNRNGEQHHYRIANMSNRLAADSISGQSAGQVSYYWYTADGALFAEQTGAGTVLRRLYYDGLGRAVGLRDVEGDNGNGPGRYRCSSYGPSAWLVSPCAGGSETSPWLVYDGVNVGATLGDRWVFVHGGGVDDPLMGLYRAGNQPGGATEYYWVTDGSGRHFAAGTSNGSLSAVTSQGMGYLNHGGTMVGATQAATSYHAERQTTVSAPSLSMFRNRVYDQYTGRWAQEDPIGIAGGVNLYQFNGSNPSAYTDPFGLRPDTLVAVGKQAEAWVTVCRAIEACGRELATAEASPEYWEYRIGPLSARCKAARIEVSCTDPQPVPGHGSGGTIYIDTSDLPKARRHKGRPNNPISILGHELSHVNGCSTEVCAQRYEGKILDQMQVQPVPSE
jgi:RHS repeat-associated protein